MPDAFPYRENEIGKSKEMVEMVSNKRKKNLHNDHVASPTFGC